MSEEELRKVLYDYKFYNLSLEKVITKILNGLELSEKCLQSKDCEEVVQEFADLLLTYKWNQTKCDKKVFMVSLRKWVDTNSKRLIVTSQ